MNSPVLLFDGVCNLCNGLVIFILDNEKQNEIKFAPLQSDVAARLMNEYKFNLSSIQFDTLVFIVDDKVYLRSRAALKIAEYLKKPYSFTTAFRVFPTVFSDFIYNIVAKYRYRIFGKKKHCMVPDEKWKDRFLN